MTDWKAGDVEKGKTELWRMNSKDRRATSVDKWCVAGGYPRWPAGDPGTA